MPELTPSLPDEEIPIWEHPTIPLEIRHKAAYISQPSIPHTFTEYMFANARNKPATLLGQLLTLYEQTYSQWPWNEQHDREKVFVNLFHTLHSNDSHDSFWHVAKRDDQVIGGLWGVVTDMSIASYWLMPSSLTNSSRDRIAFQQRLEKARDSLMDAGFFGFQDRRVTIIRDFIVSSPKYAVDSKITRKEAINARANGIVALQLIKAMLDKQIEDGYPSFLAYTVRKKLGVMGRQPPMYTMTTLLGGRELMTIGELPGDPTLELVAVGGDFHLAREKFDAYSQEEYGKLLMHEGRQAQESARRELH